MDSDLRRTRQHTSPENPEADDAPEIGSSNADSLLAKAAAFSGAAQESLKDCHRGSEAQKELERRGNRSAE